MILIVWIAEYCSAYPDRLLGLGQTAMRTPEEGIKDLYRMDHAYDRHRYWLTTGKLSKMPSEYFTENVYTTFQDVGE